METRDLNVPTKPLPVSLLTGFLGSGKTSVLNHLVRQPAFRRTLVLINEFGQIGIDQLGRAKLVKITKVETALVGAGGQNEAIAARIGQIRTQLEETSSDYDRQELEERLAALSGGVEFIRVRGTSEAEVKERKDRVDDAVNAVRAAVAEGVIQVGGIALLDAIKVLEPLKPANDEQKVGIEAVRRALQAPVRQLVENAGLAGSVIAGKLREREIPNIGPNARTGEFVDVFEAGIIDPTHVVRAALRCGSSVAALLVTTVAMVADHVEEERGSEQDLAAAD